MIKQLQTMPVEDLQALLNGLLVDSWTAAQWLRLKPATLRNPRNRYYKHSIKIGQYRYWRKEDLIMYVSRDYLINDICIDFAVAKSESYYKAHSDWSDSKIDSLVAPQQLRLKEKLSKMKTKKQIFDYGKKAIENAGRPKT